MGCHDFDFFFMLEDDFGFQLIKISLCMFFVVVVVAGGCRGDLGFGFCFYLGFGLCYFIV